MNLIESRFTIKELIGKAFTEGSGRQAFGKTKEKQLEEAKKLEEWFKTKYGKERGHQLEGEEADKKKPSNKTKTPLSGDPLEFTLEYIINNSDVFIEHILDGISVLKKDKHLYAYKVEHLIKYLNEKYSADIDTKFLDYIKCSVSKEQRYLEELKYLHEKGKAREDIAEIFCISPRQFDDDVSAIKDGFRFMNTEIKDTELSVSGQKYTSPVHPVFLALNSAQIYALTIGMKLLSKDTVFEHALSSVSDEIYTQLTDCAKDMIDRQPEVEDIVFDKSKRKFLDSREFVNDKSHLHYCQYIKSQKNYKVKYYSEAGEILTVSGTIHLSPDGRFNQILVRNDEVELLISINGVQKIESNISDDKKMMRN